MSPIREVFLRWKSAREDKGSLEDASRCVEKAEKSIGEVYICALRTTAIVKSICEYFARVGSVTPCGIVELWWDVDGRWLKSSVLLFLRGDVAGFHYRYYSAIDRPMLSYDAAHATAGDHVPEVPRVVSELRLELFRPYSTADLHLVSA